MRTIKTIIILLIVFTSFAQAQNTTKSSNQTRTIEVNNENGELLISFKNGVITKFIVNDEPILEERYSDYQEIIDDFSGEDIQPTSPSIPEPPTPSDSDRDRSGELQTMITTYLKNNAIINSEDKYKIHLTRDYLKVDGKKLASKDHNACVDFFVAVYGHQLNDKSDVKFKKSKNVYKLTLHRYFIRIISTFNCRLLNN